MPARTQAVANQQAQGKTSRAVHCAGLQVAATVYNLFAFPGCLQVRGKAARTDHILENIM